MTPEFAQVCRLLAIVGIVLVLAGAAGPSDILVPVGLVLSLVLGGIGFGVTKNKADSAHDRIDALDTRVTATLAGLDTKLDTVIKLAERIDERTRDA